MRNLESYPLSLLCLAITLLLSAVPVADATPTLYNDLHARDNHCWGGCPPEAKCVDGECVCSDDKCPQGSKCVKDKCTGISFVSFPDFLKQVEGAKFDDYVHNGVQSKEAFEEMRTHILGMYGGVTVVKDVTSFMFELLHGDCIVIKEQPSVFKLGIKEIDLPPMNVTSSNGTSHTTPHPPIQGADSPLKLGLKDEFGHPISCPPHTIPMMRLTLERLTKFPTLERFFSKVPLGSFDLSPQTSSGLGRRDWEKIHKYAVADQLVTNFGGNSFLELWNPIGDFSLSQHWYSAASGPIQTVEGGWQVKPGNTKAVLFIYYTANGYEDTNLKKCYNLDCVAFVQINHNWYLGGIWDHYSTPESRWGFEMQWKLYKGNWWLFLRGPGSYEAVGYYPTSLYEGGQMSKNAELIEYGGEVARLDGDNWPQMGSGVLSTQGPSVAATQHTIFYIPRDENDGVGVWANLSPLIADSPCYSLNITNFPNDGSWGTYIVFGGPGGDSATCGA